MGHFLAACKPAVSYRPQVGRFLAEGPLRFAAGDANLYRYVFNTPTVFTDPSGQIVWWLPWLIGAGVIVIAGAGLTYGYNSGPPSGLEELIPGWGAGRQAGACWARGEYAWSAAYCCLAGLDASLIRSLAQAGYRVGWRLFVCPKLEWMEVHIGAGAVTCRRLAEKGLSPNCGIHAWWEVAGKEWHAFGDTLCAQKVRHVPIGWYANKGCEIWYSTGKWLPVINPYLASEGCHGAHAVSCVTATLNAWSRGNYHIFPYACSHLGLTCLYLTSTGFADLADTASPIVIDLGPMPSVSDLMRPLFIPTPPMPIVPKPIDPRFYIDPCPSRHHFLR